MRGPCSACSCQAPPNPPQAGGCPRDAAVRGVEGGDSGWRDGQHRWLGRGEEGWCLRTPDPHIRPPAGVRERTEAGFALRKLWGEEGSALRGCPRPPRGARGWLCHPELREQEKGFLSPATQAGHTPALTKIMSIGRALNPACMGKKRREIHSVAL